jgi:hypothetical protein
VDFYNRSGETNICVPMNGKAMCLSYSESISVLKECEIARH